MASMIVTQNPGAPIAECRSLILYLILYSRPRRKSQIQTYLEQNEGPGLQHLALKTADIFETVENIREAEEGLCGFELMKRPSDEYYRDLPNRLGDQLTVRFTFRIALDCTHVSGSSNPRDIFLTSFGKYDFAF